MNRWIFAVAVLILFSPAVKAYDTILCFKKVEINITSLDPGPAVMRTTNELERDSKRKNKIILRMDVDCKTGKVRVPASPAEAKDWLEFALPYDFKTALTAGEGNFDSYMYTPYGYTAEYDLYNYFNAQWKLKPGSTICKAFPPKPTDKKDVNWCFYQMLDSVRNDFKNAKAWSPADGGR